MTKIGTDEWRQKMAATAEVLAPLATSKDQLFDWLEALSAERYGG